MTDIDELVAEAREWEASETSWGDNGLVSRLTDALEAKDLANKTNAREADEALHAAARHKSDAALFELERDRYRAAIEQAEDHVTRHYLDLRIGQEVLDILSGALNPPEIVRSYAEVEDMQ